MHSHCGVSCGVCARGGAGSRDLASTLRFNMVLFGYRGTPGLLFARPVCRPPCKHRLRRPKVHERRTGAGRRGVAVIATRQQKRNQRTEPRGVRAHAQGQSKQARQSSGGVPSTCRTRNETGSLGRRTLAGSGGDREARAATLEAMVAWRRSSAGSGDDVSGEREPPTAKNPSES